MKKIIAIVGPTASGKSALAIELAKRFNGEIVSCDSMQIYKHMDIGTAKPSKEELDAVPHHMIDIADPSDDCAYSCAAFVDTATPVIDGIISRGRTPLLCGGTGLYVDSIVNATEFSEMENDEEYRKELFDLAAKKGNEHVYDILKVIDPECAASNHPNNLKRVIRALEIYHATGITKTEWDKRSHDKKSEYDAAFIGLAYEDREILYERINLRVDIMMQHGLYEEVKKLYDMGIIKEGSTAAQAIGYKELFAVIKGEASFEEAVESIKRESRRYAKRQMTWFKRNKNIHWIYPDTISTVAVNDDTFKIIVNNAADYLKSLGFYDTITAG